MLRRNAAFKLRFTTTFLCCCCHTINVPLTLLNLYHFTCTKHPCTSPPQELILSLDIAFLLRYGRSFLFVFFVFCFTHQYGHSSFSCRFLLLPLSALVAGPQFGVGFGWYRTNFTLEDCVTVMGCEVKLASALGDSSMSMPQIPHMFLYPYLGSFCSRIRAGEFGGIFSIFTGCVLTQER